MSFVYTEEGTTLHSIFTLCLPDVMALPKKISYFSKNFSSRAKCEPGMATVTTLDRCETHTHTHTHTQ